MNTALIIYLAEVSESVRELIYAYFWMMGAIVMLVILFTPMLVDVFGMKLSTLKRLKLPLIGVVIAAIIYVFLPTKNTIYLLASAKVTEDIVRSPEAKQLGDKILKIINGKLDEQLEPKKK